MIILGVVLIVLGSLIPNLDPGGKKTMIVSGIVLLIVGVALILLLVLSPGTIPERYRIGII